MIKELDFSKAKGITEECIVMANKIDEIIEVLNSITEKPKKSSTLIFDDNKVICKVYDSEVDKTEVIVTDLKATKISKDGIEIIGGELNFSGTICNMECSKATIDDLRCGGRNVDYAPGAFNTPTPWVPCQVDETVLIKANIETLKNNKLI
ncbi:hypothetical protein KPL40_03975 [Clostridium gasigenes]|uniref:hypothetical protein n=1 Tax=Clostridium gasigenes TaxID=94869 RepID=UPI001C0CDD01|nr:hypothetical protein [Clostridium gasigenes]MBU3131600.1 hypothetical protein [Clostridium gasigenes]